MANKLIYQNLFNKTEVGFIIDWKFHKANKWVSAYSPFLINAIINEFNPIIITSQKAYNNYRNRLKYVISMEPGFAAPKIMFRNQSHKTFVFVSDPHSKTNWFQEYIDENAIDYVLSLYNSPFFYHFPNFPKQKFIHFPWAVPDQMINNTIHYKGNNDVALFGGLNSDAYDIRNWCKEQNHINYYNFSGVENKKLDNHDYYHWLRNFDAIIAAGSSNPIYDLLTPKYFEILSSGALLIGQYCTDMQIAGINETNAVIFTKDNFNQQVKRYIENPCAYLDIRSNGLELIKKRHTLSNRIELLKEYMKIN